jgi:hypothetical protein
MARDAEIKAGYEAVPSPQWVKDRSGVGNVLSDLSSSVDKRDIGRQRDVGGGVELLVNMKKTGNRSL